MFTWKQSGREERPGAQHRTRVGPSKARNYRERNQLLRINQIMKRKKVKAQQN